MAGTKISKQVNGSAPLHDDDIPAARAGKGKRLQFLATPNAQTGTSYTLAKDDYRKIITFNNASSITVTLPQQSTVALPAGWWCGFKNIGAGQITFVKEGSETLTGSTIGLPGYGGTINRKTTTNWDIDTSTITSTTITNTLSSPTTNNIDKMTRGGSDYQVYAKPLFYRKKIVVVGSSVAFGSGASVASNGWANLTLTALESLGWTTKNVAVGGDTTAAVISRFYTDVAPENPDIVLIGLGLGNEISADTDENDFNRMVRNMRQLVRMIRQQGAIPVIGGPYPRGTFTAAQIVYNNQLAFEYDAMGVPWINFASLDTGSDWIASAKSDDAHPNDTGHAEMAKCVELSMFDHLLYNQQLTLPKSIGSIQVNTTTPTNSAPIIYTPKTAFGSFTCLFRIRSAGSLNNLSFFGIGTNTTIRIRNADPGAFNYVNDDDTGVITSSVNPGADNAEHSLCVTYNALTTVLTFYIDGVSQGTVTDSITATNIAIGCRYGHATFGQLHEFKDLTVWRTALTARQVLQAHKGEYSKGSLEFYNHLGNLDTTMTHIANYAPTDNWAVLDTASNVVTAVHTRNEPILIPFNIIGTILNQKYVIIPKATFNGRIQHLIQEATSLGTAGNYTVKIGSTNVTGLAAVTNTTAVTDTKATGAYDFVVGDEVSITFASTVSLVDFFSNLLVTKKNTS